MLLNHYLLTRKPLRKSDLLPHPENPFAKARKTAIRLVFVSMINIAGTYHAGAQCGDAPINFRAATSFEVVGTPKSIAAGDFNSDGRLDVAIATAVVDGFSILSGTGTGSFNAAINYGVPDPTSASTPASVTSGDFNGDGKSDLAIISSGSYSGTLLLNDNYGSFRLAAYFEVGATPEAITAGDFNGDSKLDLATANLGSNDVSVLLGNGTGRFGAAARFSVGIYPKSITAGDFNGDGKLDLATANLGSNDISVLLGDGAGGFAKSTSIGLEFFAQSLTAGDFNGDGKVDIVTATSVADAISVLLGNGAGSFSAATHFKVDGVDAITSGDFNKDGKLDVAAGYTTGGKNRVMVLLNTCGQGLQGKPNLPPKDSADANNNKVLVCHNGKTLQVAQSAVKAHLKHGDTFGACMEITTVSKAHAEVPTITVYPNPNNGQFAIALQGVAGGSAEVQVLNANGVVVERRQVVFNTKIQTLRVNIKGKSSGMHVVKVRSAAGIQMQKVVVQQ